MNVTIQHKLGKQFEATARTHKIIVDQISEKGGTDLGMNPLEVFLCSLGSCVAAYAHKYCQDLEIDPTGFKVDVESELAMNDKPIRFKDIKIKITLKTNLGDKKNSFLRFVKNCPIHNTVLGKPSVTIEA